MRTPRGFTLIELLIAGSASAVVVFFAFMTIGQIQGAAASQRREVELISQGRLALELIGRDIRGAGDAVQFLPYHCLQGAQAPSTPDGCPAILDPHPWRITLARNARVTPAGALPGTAADTISLAPFDQSADNVVTYQFVPRLQVGDGWLGRIERIRNPFSFGGLEPERAILLDQVLLDDRMKLDPQTETSDARYDASLFMYRVMSAFAGEYVGDGTIVSRATRNLSFVLPPARFFPIPGAGGLAAQAVAPPYLPAYGSPEIVGLRANASPSASLRADSHGFTQDLRYVLDYNRIRAVRVSFKVVEADQDPTFDGGIKLDPQRPGTARVVPMEATFEMKVFSSFL